MIQEEDFSGFFERNKALIQSYINARTLLLKLQVGKIASRSLSKMLVGMVVAFMFFTVIFFLGLALCFWLGSVWNNTALGFVGGAGIFLMFTLLVLLFSKQLILIPMQKSIIREIAEDIADD